MKYLCLTLAIATTLAIPISNAAILVDLYHGAKENNPQYHSDLATVEANRENENIAKGAILPRISLTANGVRSGGETEIITRGITDKDNESWGYGLSLNQPLYNRQAIKAYDEAKAYGRVYELQYEQIHNQLILDTVSLYTDVLKAKETIIAREADERALNRQLMSSEDRLAVGLGTAIELNQARASYALSRASLAQSRSDLTIAEINLKQSVGHVPKEYFVLRDDIKLDLESRDLGTLDSWLEKLNSSIEYQIALEQALISRKVAERISGQRWPELSLFADHTFNDMDDDIENVTSRDTSNRIGLQFTQSVYQGGSIAAQVRQANKQLKAAEMLKEAAYLSTKSLITQAYDALIVGQKRLKALREGSEAAALVLLAQMDSFDVGVASQNDVLDAQGTASDAHSNYISALYDQLITELNLRNVVNELNESVLQEISDNAFTKEHITTN